MGLQACTHVLGVGLAGSSCQLVSVLIVCLAISDDPGLSKMLSILYRVLRKKGCSQEEKEWMAKPPVAKGG